MGVSEPAEVGVGVALLLGVGVTLPLGVGLGVPLTTLVGVGVGLGELPGGVVGVGVGVGARVGVGVAVGAETVFTVITERLVGMAAISLPVALEVTMVVAGSKESVYVVAVVGDPAVTVNE